jgi:hypothetical protein
MYFERFNFDDQVPSSLVFAWDAPINVDPYSLITGLEFAVLYVSAIIVSFWSGVYFHCNRSTLRYTDTYNSLWWDEPTFSSFQSNYSSAVVIAQLPTTARQVILSQCVATIVDASGVRTTQQLTYDILVD